jgi:hypothetical protein
MHYYTIVKHQDKWFKIDDNSVSTISESDALRPSAHSYLAVYEQWVGEETLSEVVEAQTNAGEGALATIANVDEKGGSSVVPDSSTSSFDPATESKESPNDGPEINQAPASVLQLSNATDAPPNVQEAPQSQASPDVPDAPAPVLPSDLSAVSSAAPAPKSPLDLTSSIYSLQVPDVPAPVLPSELSAVSSTAPAPKSPFDPTASTYSITDGFSTPVKATPVFASPLANSAPLPSLLSSSMTSTPSSPLSASMISTPASPSAGPGAVPYKVRRVRCQDVPKIVLNNVDTSTFLTDAENKERPRILPRSIPSLPSIDSLLAAATKSFKAEVTVLMCFPASGEALDIPDDDALSTVDTSSVIVAITDKEFSWIQSQM